jgi:hypothetical protein
MTFKTGDEWNGNRLGRRPGTGFKQRLFNELVMPQKEALITKAISLALEGDGYMLRLFLERLLPDKLFDETASFKIPAGNITAESFKEIADNVLHSLERGESSPTQVKALFEIFKAYNENVVINDLALKIKTLEQQFNRPENHQTNQKELK